MHSLFLQVNTFNKLESFIEKQNLFMNNISLYFEKCGSKTKSCICENLETLIDTLNPRAKGYDESENKTTSAEYSEILMKAKTILKEVIKGHSMKTDSLSAITSRQTDSEDTIPASCFKVVYEKELDVANDHGNNSCFNINAQPGKKVTFHCGNKNIRIADAVVTEIAVEGRVEVRYNNHWGTVCSAYNYFGEKNANVACRAAGFTRGVGGYNVPTGSGPIWLSRLYCNGQELDLFDCDRQYGISGYNCDHSQDALST
ncbi:CD5 antigen-like [Ruditapes philippinarum]|uniref:CD5 antigen-like n=1 Tax=Ruditapes philippinarum TaxID=129788 RepID=UPI00295AF3A2|nr:CD5 antigen-like [Ruditapes philippinarum]